MKNRYFKRFSCFLFLFLFLFHIESKAHIIPPENFHPVAESYRRINFFLNLNPIPWELTQEEVQVIANHYEKISSKAGRIYYKESDGLISQSIKDPSGNRDEVAQKVFVLSTQAVAKILIFHLEAASRSLKNYSQAYRHLNEARQIWASFDYEVKESDYPAYLKIGRCWLELASSLGSPGILQVGYEPAREEHFHNEAKDIIKYVDTNYGKNFQPDEMNVLAPLPLNSRTFQAHVQIPAKLPPGSNINKQIPRPRQILNMVARGVDEMDTSLIALGDMAFDSSYVFGEPARSMGISCNTCHNKSITNPNLFIPGLSARAGGIDVSNSFFAPHANNGHFDPLDIPDLRGIRFTAPYGRNGRFSSLREFVRNVIINEFNGPEPDPLILDGTIAYMNEFDFLPNPYLNSDGTLNEKASKLAKKGEKIFHKPFKKMAGKSCATCHIPSNQFIDHKRHDIGTVQGAEAYSKDRAMDTPTLLSAKYSAPYFHDGSQPTLRAVVRWFDENYRLKLGERKIDALTAYLETVGEGEEAYEDTIYYLDAELEEFSFFLSAYEYLEKVNKPELMNITFQTIANEIRNHQWELQDPQYRPILTQLAQFMDEAYAANKQGDAAKVKLKVASYRQLYAKNVDLLK